MLTLGHKSILDMNERYIAEFVIACAAEFAKKFGITLKQAYNYLNRYKAVDYLMEHYEIEHTQTFNDVTDRCADICNQHGGKITR